MSDDIVDDLRLLGQLAHHGKVQLVMTDGEVFVDAADEIDKLRSLVRVLRREIEATRAPNPHRPMERAEPTAPVRPLTRWRDL